MNVNTTDKERESKNMHIYKYIIKYLLLLEVENFGQGNNEVELEEDTCCCVGEFVCCGNGRGRFNGK